jgi:Uma2 family endonuclease
LKWPNPRSPTIAAPKASLYAKAGVPDYWIVDLIHRWLEVRREPVAMTDRRHGRGYALRARCGEDETVECPLLPGVRIAVRDLMP